MSHRVTEDWLGEPVETLEDLLRDGLYAVCVGINPSPVSVEAGHYYQGSLGQRFYGQLHRIGLLPADARGWEDDALYELGVGFTDIVKRATATAAELRPDEFKHGKPLLRPQARRDGTDAGHLHLPQDGEEAVGKAARTGFFDPGVGNGVTYFAMPGPYEKRERRALLNELKRHIAKIRD